MTPPQLPAPSPASVSSAAGCRILRHAGGLPRCILRPKVYRHQGILWLPDICLPRISVSFCVGFASLSEFLRVQCFLVYIPIVTLCSESFCFWGVADDTREHPHTETHSCRCQRIPNNSKIQHSAHDKTRVSMFVVHVSNYHVAQAA